MSKKSNYSERNSKIEDLINQLENIEYDLDEMNISHDVHSIISELEDAKVEEQLDFNKLEGCSIDRVTINQTAGTATLTMDEDDESECFVVIKLTKEKVEASKRIKKRG